MCQSLQLSTVAVNAVNISIVVNHKVVGRHHHLQPVIHHEVLEVEMISWSILTQLSSVASQAALVNNLGLEDGHGQVLAGCRTVRGGRGLVLRYGLPITDV